MTLYLKRSLVSYPFAAWLTALGVIATMPLRWDDSNFVFVATFPGTLPWFLLYGTSHWLEGHQDQNAIGELWLGFLAAWSVCFAISTRFIRQQSSNS